jgi:asparagine synthase (glutamine-hydrolysing)
MCGIAGIYDRDKNVLSEGAPLYRMQRILAHRGPDDEGVDLLPEVGVGLVHTRLSVIDLSPAGHQPMWNDDRTIGIIFNGEIYNFLELRRELESRQVIFHSQTDTEVILRGYESWGSDVVTRLNGMFAFAVWDERRKLVWLVRDRLGKKPLYYWYEPAKNVLLFASEIKALLEWPCIRRQVDPSALQCYLALGYVPAPYTMFDGIKKLPAGHWLRYDSHDLEIRRYWSLSSLGAWKASPEEYRQNIRAAVEQAVERRLISDVPLGAFFSGGVDSSIVVGLMSQMMRKPVRTFSAAFDVGPRSFKYNVDADMADVASQTFGTCHTRLTLKPADNLLDHIRRVVWHMDEPHANPTLVTTYLLAQMVKQQGVTVVLSGDGSDELFGGYGRYLADRYVTCARQVPAAVRQLFLKALGFNGKAVRFSKVLRKAEILPRSPQRYLTWWNIFDPVERLMILSSQANNVLDAPHKCITSLVAGAATTNDQEFLAYLDLSMWIAEESNMRVDKMSMAHALEVRAPFLDYTLVNQAMSIPFSEKVTWRDGKRLLKDAFSDVLPGVVLNRPKWGWLSPVHYWIQDSLWEEAKRLICWLPKTGLFSREVVNVLDEYPPRSPQKIWSLMIFALWYREYVACEYD